MEASRSVRDDVKCELRSINFRIVSDPMKAFWPAFRETEISDDWYRSTLGVIVMRLGTPRCARENFECTWQNLCVPATSLGALMTSLETPVRSLGATRTTVQQGGKNIIFFGNTAGAPGNHSLHLSFNDC